MRNVPRKLLLGIVLVVGVAGFLHDVVNWMREGDRSVGDALQQYWWAVMFVVLYGGDALVKYARRSDSRANGGSSG